MAGAEQERSGESCILVGVLGDLCRSLVVEYVELSFFFACQPSRTVLTPLLSVLPTVQYWGCLELTLGLPVVWQRVALITLVSAILELVPIVDDNYSVPLSAALGTLLLFPSSSI